MNNLLLYIQALQCRSIMTLLQHAKVENDTVYVLNSDYQEAAHNTGGMSIIDAIIHNTSHCQYFKYLDHRITYKWNDDIKLYKLYIPPKKL